MKRKIDRSIDDTNVEATEYGLKGFENFNRDSGSSK